MSKVLVIVDMQNDFIDGALANKSAQKIVNTMATFASKWEGTIIFTRDTHSKDYLETQEGKYLPVPHCICYSRGWEINEKIFSSAKQNKKAKIVVMNKETFGSRNSLPTAISTIGKTLPEEIVLCGTCTDICVVSNALILKAAFPEIPVKVIPALCAGLTPAKHKAAIEVMRSCQVEILE